MKNKNMIISMILAILMIATTFTSVGSVEMQNGGCGGDPETSDITVEKKVYNGTAWVDEIEADLNDIVRFNITISYYGNNESSFMETNISVKDTLPDSLEFADNILITYGTDEYYNYTAKSEDNKTIWWNLTKEESSWLDDTIILWNLTKYPDEIDSVSIYFDAKVVNYTDYDGEKNVVNVEAWETCTHQHVYGSAEATVIAREPENPEISIDKKVKDPATDEFVDGPLNVYYDDLGIPAQLEFQINVSNTGNVDLHNPKVTDVLPDFLEYNSHSTNYDPAPTIIFTQNGKNLTWEWNDQTVSEEDMIITLVVNVTSSSNEIKTGTNFVNVTVDEDTEDEDTVDVTIKPHIIVDKKVKDPISGEWLDELDYVIKSEPLQFKITTTYYGKNTMRCMLVFDELPECLEYNKTVSVRIAGEDITPDRKDYPNIYIGEGEIIKICNQDITLPEGNIIWSWIEDKNIALYDGETVEIIFETDVKEYCEDCDCEQCCWQQNCAFSMLWGCCPCELYQDEDCVDIRCCPPPPIFEKKVKNETGQWADEVNTIVGETLEFKLTLEYYGNENLTHIKMKDKLPCILEYVPLSSEVEVINGDAKLKKVELSEKGKIILFEFNGSLYDNGMIALTFEAFVNGSTGDCSECGICKNRANVTGYIWEGECDPDPFFANDSVNIFSDSNCPPDPLWIKTEDGPNGKPGDTMTFTSKVYDPNDDKIRYQFKVGCEEGDWSDWIESNTTIEYEYTFEAEGIFTIRIRAEDEHGLGSGWQCHVDIVIKNDTEDNCPPSVNGISGPTKGEVDEELEFSTTISDPDNDKVKYQLKVRGNTKDWSELAEPGKVYYTLSFDEKGTHSIQIRAEDEHGLRSGWSEEFEVEIGEDDDDSDGDGEAGIINRLLELLRNLPIIKLILTILGL